MEGDFSWLWRNEDLSDFTLLIRERPVGSIQAATPEDPASAAAAAAAGGGAGGDAAAAAAAGGGAGGEDGDHRQTRAGKRRRVSAPAAPAAPDTAAAAAAAGGGGRNTRSRRSLQQPPLPPQHNPQQQGGGAGAPGPNIQLQQAEGQEQQQQQQEAGARPFVQRLRQHAQNQRVAAAAAGGGAGGAAAAAGAGGGNNNVPQAAAGRSTRRSSRQNRQQQQQQDEQQGEGQQEEREEQNQQQQEQQPAQQVDQQQQQQQQGGNADGRRTRRSSGARGGRQNLPAAAAAAAGAGQQDGHDAAAAAAGDEQQPGQTANAAAAAAAAGGGDGGGGGGGGGEQPTAGRATRSSRSKKRTSEAAAAAAAAAGAGAGAGTARTRGAQQQQQQQQLEQQQQQRGSDPGSSDGPPAAGRRSQRRQAAMQQLQHSMQQLTTEGSDGGAGAAAAAAAGGGGGAGGGAGATTTQQQQAGRLALFPASPDDDDDDFINIRMAPPSPAVEIRVPVHAVVLAGFSEYFKALICSWSNHLNKTLTLDVGPDEGNAALLMVQFMYTGKLPDASPEELLKMVRLADQYQVSRFMAAASHSFESLPLTTITQNVMLEVFRLPQLMLDAPEMSRVVAKARAKLLDLYGDLEKVWACETLREQFLALPFPAVRCLLASDATQVAAENTALVVLAGWVEEGPQGHRSNTEQLKELLGLIRLPYLTASFVGDVLHAVPWVNDLLDSRQLLNAFQFAIASESTRQRLAAYDYGPSSLTPHFRCPRPTSSVTRCSFDWSFELSTVKRMVADAQLWGRVVELSSPLHYFAGFWWQLLFNVEKSPTPPDAPPEVAAAQQPAVIEFVGVRCHVNCGAHDYWPRVVRFKASISALQTGFWEMDFAYQKAIEGPIVDGVGLGYPGFFALPGQALDNEAAWSRFVRGGRVHLRCEVTDCE